MQAKLSAGEQLAVLDVRSAGDFATAHVPGARWLSRGKLDIEIEQHVPNKSTPVILMCRAGNLSPLSVPTLKALGYRNVAVLQGDVTPGRLLSCQLSKGWAINLEMQNMNSSPLKKLAYSAAARMASATNAWPNTCGMRKL